jgi:hypothetical protein
MTSPDPAAEPGGAAPSGAGSPAPASAQPAPQQSPQEKAEFARMRKALSEKEKELETFKAAAMTDQEKAIVEARTQGASEWRSRYLAAAKTNAVLSALAAKGVAAPELALGALNLHDVEIDEATGRVDQSVLDSRIDEVIKRYPMLTNSPGQPTTSGTGQRQVTGANLVTTNKDGQLDAKSDAMLRWALGGKQPD